IPIQQLAGWPNNHDAFTRALLPYMESLERTALLARLPTIWLTTLLGALLWRWGKALWGTTAGLLALAILAFDPTLLAHGRLATSDAGVTAIGAAALYAAWRWRQRPTGRAALLAGLLLGLTLLAKSSGPLWVASAVLMMLSALRPAHHNQWELPRLGHILAASSLSLLILWAGYGFTVGKVTGIPLPLPAPSYWENTVGLTDYNDAYFALDQRQNTRWWWYFPLAFMLKNPLPLLLGLALGLFALLRRRANHRPLWLLGIFPTLYTAAAITQGLNLGYRHMLPIHPFLHLLIAGGVTQAWRAWQAPALLKKALPVILSLWYSLGTLAVWPYEISYFNELTGGPEHAYHYLADSNLEWGQTQKALTTYVQEHPTVHSDAPEAKFHPEAGCYIVNASYLQGIGLVDPDSYAWFRYWDPTATFKRSLLIYDVPAFTPAWIAQCGAPDAPLDAAAIAAGTGCADLRNVSFDCTRAWLYPGGATQPGLYALDTDLLAARETHLLSLLPDAPHPQDPFIQRQLTRARLSFEQHPPQPAFVLYEMTDARVSPTTTAPVYAAPVESVPATLDKTLPLNAPLALDGPLAFLGIASYQDEAAWEVETWWRVTQGPITRPLSIMAHLITADGAALGADDGLNVWPLTLAVGDVFVQRHRFTPAPDQTDVWLRTGVYWLDTQERWKILWEDMVSAPDDVLLLPIHVDQEKK
ncbi:MAG TPA: glycosyltransferase family 39 protein, partial [Anaerolineae bacterium]|nr:glycosyltransferase family 39 protein [Anaerolineae bacterium]